MTSTPIRELSSADRDAVRAERMRRDFRLFARWAWPIVEPANKLITGWHFDAVCDHLVAVARGEIRKLLIEIPPGHAKSLITSVLWLPWVWTWRPEWRGLFASYAAPLATRDAVRARQLLESAEYQRLFTGGGWTLARLDGEKRRALDPWEFSEAQNVKSNFANTASGYRLALSVDGQTTGYRGNALVADDPLNAMEAMHSPAAREHAIAWWKAATSTRLNDPRRDARVVVMQRLHSDDLAGFLETTGEYEVLRLPTEFDPERRAITYHVVGGVRREFWRDPRAERDELLFPELFDRSVVEGLKKPDALGAHGFAAQHNQDPSVGSGRIFRRGWWRFWRDPSIPRELAAKFKRPDGCTGEPARELPARFDLVVVALDASFGSVEEATASRVCMQAWAVAGVDYFLLDSITDFMPWKRTRDTFAAFCLRFMSAKKVVEKKANGAAIIDELRARVPGLVAYEPDGSKEARAMAVSPRVEGGNCYLPEHAPWLDDFVKELTAFPDGKHDDQVDALSMSLRELGETSDVLMAKALVKDLPDVGKIWQRVLR